MLQRVVYTCMYNNWVPAWTYLRRSSTGHHASFSRRLRMNELVYKSDDTCIEQLRMDRASFHTLCSMLESNAGLKPTKYMLVDEQVAIFLHLLAHHVKDRVIKFNFRRPSKTVSRHFCSVLTAVLQLYTHLLAKPMAVSADCTDERWKYFKDCLGAIDGTHIRVRVPEEDKPRYRNRKGKISQNVIAACTPDECFIYVLAGWEGSATDSRILGDALTRDDNLQVPVGHYYLVDTGFLNAPGCIAPYPRQRYHLNEWREGRRLSTPEEYFNYQHASAHNVIKRCFRQLKGRWVILRSQCSYPPDLQTKIILVCTLLHNFIKMNMPNECPIVDDHHGYVAVPDDGEYIQSFIPTKESLAFRDELAMSIFSNREGANITGDSTTPMEE